MKKRLSIMMVVMLVGLALVSTVAFAEVKTGGELKKAAEAKITSISPDELDFKLDMGEEIKIIDVRRTVEEFNLGHIKGAVNVPRGLLEFKVGKKIKDKDATIVVMCASGGRSALATLKLQEMGYTNVLNLKGGFKGWVKAGYEMVNEYGTFKPVK